MTPFRNIWHLLSHGVQDAFDADFYPHAICFETVDGDRKLRMYYDRRRVDFTTSDDGALTMALKPDTFTFPTWKTPT